MKRRAALISHSRECLIWKLDEFALGSLIKSQIYSTLGCTLYADLKFAKKKYFIMRSGALMASVKFHFQINLKSRDEFFLKKRVKNLVFQLIKKGLCTKVKQTEKLWTAPGNLRIQVGIKLIRAVCIGRCVNALNLHILASISSLWWIWSWNICLAWESMLSRFNMGANPKVIQLWEELWEEN